MEPVSSTSEVYAGPDDVPCDVCAETKLRAQKTCLTCMASYCETHLQPHRDSAALRRHKLEEPIRTFEEKLCRKHQKVLEIFCRTDGTCVCYLCVATEHKNHDTVIPSEERARRQSQLEKRRAEIKKMIEKKEQKLEAMQESLVKIQSFKRPTAEASEPSRDHEWSLVRMTEDLMKQLKEEIRQLKRRDAELAELSQTDDHIHFLQTFLSFCDHRRDGDIAADGDLLPETMGTRETVVKTPGCSQQNMTSRHEFLKYFSPLTLDPNTANRRLCLSKGNTRVTSAVKIVPYPDHPDRFDTCEQVLCREALSGTRCYWEVEWDGDEVDIGVTYKEINRKAETKECRLGFNDKSWSLTCSHFKCSVWHNKVETQFNVPSSHTFGVYLDCPAGSLSFYRVLPKMTFLNMILLHTFNASFSEPLYPGFGLGLDTSVTIRSP